MNRNLADIYLRHLRLEREKPSLEGLRRLVSGHLRRVPFENISKIYYYQHRARKGLAWLPDPEMFLEHLTTRGLGGNCYILNKHFGELLRSLGYEVELVKAVGGNVHLALRVFVEGTAYYVDVGYGAPLFAPLRLEEEPRFTRCGEEVDIRRTQEQRYRIDRRAGGQSFVVKEIEWTPVSLESFEDGITHSLRDEDENPFMRRIVATLFQGDTGYSVVGSKLFVKSAGGTEVHEYTDRSDWLRMLRVTFGFDSSAVNEAVEFLQARGVRMFG